MVTTLGAILLGLPIWLGLLVASTAMAGDLFSSFLKRRLSLRQAAKQPDSISFRNCFFRCSLAKQRISKPAKRFAAIIAKQNTQIIAQGGKYLFQPAHRAIIHVGVEVTHMKQSEAIKCQR